MYKYVWTILIIVGVLGIPAQWRMLGQNRPFFTPDIDDQYRALLPDVPYDMLRQVDGLLGPETAVLLITNGSDIHRTEYTTYHRALYFLTPRPVWWLADAPADNTWGARWRIAAPLTAESITHIAQEKGLTCVLTVQTDLPVGQQLVAWEEGALWQVGGECPVEQQTAVSIRANWWGVLGGVLVLWLIGYVLLDAVILRVASKFGQDWIEKVALAWIIGAGVGSVLLGWLAMAGVPHIAQRIGFTTAVLLLVKSSFKFQVSGFRSQVSSFRFQVSSFSLLSPPASLLTLFLLWQTAFVAIMSLGRPLITWDSWVNWGMKARILYQAGFTPALYADPSRLVTMPDYPLLLPILESWLYGWGGAADDRVAGMLLFLFYLAGLGVCYSAVSRHAPQLAMVATTAWAALNTLNLLFVVVYTDAVVAVLALTAVFYLYQWQKTDLPQRTQRTQRTEKILVVVTPELVIALVMLGLMPWAKREGLLLVAALCLAVSMPPIKHYRLFIVGTLFSVALLSGFWLLVAHFYALPNPNFLPITPQTVVAGIGRLPTIAWNMAKLLAGTGFNFLWPMVLLLFLWNWRTLRVDSFHWPFTAAVLYIGIMSLTYIVSDYAPYQQHLASSAYRLVAQVAAWPLVWLVELTSRNRVFQKNLVSRPSE